MKPILEIQNISKKYKLRGQETPYLTIRDAIWGKNKRQKTDEFWALDDISFNVYPGESIGVIGRNGAGKSTLLKILSRITPPTKGKIISRGRIASLLEVGTGFHAELTGMENIFLNGSILGLKKIEIQKKLDEIIDFAGVEKFIETPLKHYSSGMQLRLAFAVAAHLEPEILIIDEVLAVGDAEFQKKSLGKMEDITKQGRTVIFVSHNMAAVQNLCGKGVLLQDGKVLLNDKIGTVIDNYLVNNSANLNIDDKLLIKNRSGNQKIKFSNFHIEDDKGNIIDKAINGKDIYFVFSTYSENFKDVSNLDIGFSLHLRNETSITVNYSSYYNKVYNNISERNQFKFKFNNFPLNKGVYKIGARILENGIEADWPKDGLAEFEVVDGDFYKSGSLGFENSHLLLSGVWE